MILKSYIPKSFNFFKCFSMKVNYNKLSLFMYILIIDGRKHIPENAITYP
jgi:hypothetical protein